MYFKAPLNHCPTVQRTKTGFFVVLHFKLYFYCFNYVCVSVCEYMPLSGGSHRGQKRASNHPGARVAGGGELLDADAGNQTQAPRGTVPSLNCWVLFLAQYFYILNDWCVFWQYYLKFPNSECVWERRVGISGLSQGVRSEDRSVMHRGPIEFFLFLF